MSAAPERIPRIRVVMMPKDTNPLGTIFGGVILSYIDLAAAEAARKITTNLFVTKIMKEIDFIAPVFVGDTVSFYTEVTRVGNTSVTVKVSVEAERGESKDDLYQVTEAEVVMVAVDEDRKPVKIKKKG